MGREKNFKLNPEQISKVLWPMGGTIILLMRTLLGLHVKAKELPLIFIQNKVHMTFDPEPNLTSAPLKLPSLLTDCLLCPPGT